jgi:uncharacterized damage-inducible protein DinB
MNRPLAHIFQYNKWATLTLLNSCSALTDDQLDTRLAAASGTVRELLVHIVGGQQTLVLRTKGRQHEGELNRQSAWPGFDTLRQLAVESCDELITIAEALDEDSDVDLPWQGKSFHFPKSFFLVHAVEHGVEHRTEVKLALASIGITTPDLDGWQFSEAQSYG